MKKFTNLFVVIMALVLLYTAVPNRIRADRNEQTVSEPFTEILYKQETDDAIQTLYATHPELTNTMPVTVTTPANGTENGLIFITNVGFLTEADPGLLILDDSGEPIYLQVNTPGQFTTDFKVQVVNGTPYLVYHEGDPGPGWTQGKYYVMDNTYTVVDVWEMQNGHHADLHDIQLLDNGNALMLAYTAVPADLSPYGGPTDGSVLEIVIQELNAAREVVFEWYSLDHIPLTDSYISLVDSPVDYLHSNAIEVDTDDNLLVSNRNTSDIIKIDRTSGDIIWRLGGKNNEFTFTNDDGFSYQHDIRRLESGNITLFDNGVQNIPQYSRVVEYAIDEDARTVTRVWQYPESPGVYAPYMGGGQRLGNGNTMIGWGAVPTVSEVKPDGSLALEMSLGGLTYRAFRFEWDALPAAVPHIAVSSEDDTTVTVYSSWNGATQITGYEIYAGLDIDSMSLVTTTQRTGFETAVSLTNLDAATCVFQNRPIHAQGDTVPFSAIAYRIDRPACIALMPYHLRMPLIHK